MSVLLLSGPSGTGKTTVARSLCESHDGQFVSERQICHALAEEHGFGHTRLWIGAVGAVQVGRELAARTVEEVRASYLGGLMVIDGVYQPELVQEVSAATAETPKVAFVDAPRHVRLLRVARRAMIASAETAIDLAKGAQEMAFLDGVKAEFGLERMRDVADWALDGTQQTAVLQAEVERLLGLTPAAAPPFSV